VTASRELVVRAGEVVLAGSLWPPDRPAKATVFMYPGSGPSDRDNDVFFPPIRTHLVARGFAVCSFDKRGVGGSAGRWQDAGIPEQADDLLAAVASLTAGGTIAPPVGLFGHSQGGWVVIEAAGRGAPVAFVVTNSGPGVSPAEQERYSLRTTLALAGSTEAETARALRSYDAVVSLLRERVPLAEAVARLANDPDTDPTIPGLEFLFEDPANWSFGSMIFEYDPRPALSRLRVPVLAVLGENDLITPVGASVAAYEEAVAPELLELAVFPGADHRLEHGDPPALAHGYLATLVDFVERAVAAAQVEPATLAQESFRPSVRLKTSRPGAESGSGQK
jgi:pimeloyl-ACP methyl ester carboxylesterase